MTDLVIKNHSLGGTKEGYIYGGKIFSHLPKRFLRGLNIALIDRTLVSDAAFLMDLQDRLERDEQYVRQSLSLILPHIRTSQDLRDALPEVFVSDIPQVRGLPRTREEGYPLRDRPTQLNQFQKAIDLALRYRAMQLIH